MPKYTHSLTFEPSTNSKSSNRLQNTASSLVAIKCVKRAILCVVTAIATAAAAPMMMMCVHRLNKQND